MGPRICGAGHYLSITGGGGDINDLAPEQCGCVPGNPSIPPPPTIPPTYQLKIKRNIRWTNCKRCRGNAQSCSRGDQIRQRLDQGLLCVEGGGEISQRVDFKLVPFSFSVSCL